MLQKEKVPHKLGKILREKRFVLDCTNYQKSKYQQYNSFKDKYLGYIVSCPCTHSLPKQCRSKLKKNLVKTQIIQSSLIHENSRKTLKHISRQHTQPPQQDTSKQYLGMGSKERLKKMIKIIGQSIESMIFPHPDDFVTLLFCIIGYKERKQGLIQKKEHNTLFCLFWINYKRRKLANDSKDHQKKTRDINHDKFLRFRAIQEPKGENNQCKKCQTQNPFEQNWKKAIIMDQLLALYKPHVGGIPPSSANCTKNQYVLQYPLHFNNENEDTYWNTNEESQLNKYYKMADGINRWEEMFQRDHIEQAACKIQKRLIGHRKPNTVSQIQVQNKKYHLKKKRLHQHFSSSSLSGFSNLMRKSQTNLKNQKQQFQRLQKIAIKQYGLNFKERSQKNEIQFDVQQFKNKDRQIFDKFMSTMPQSPKMSQKPHQATINSNIPSSIQLKRAYPHSKSGSSIRQVHLPKSAQCSRKKHYVRIVCD